MTETTNTPGHTAVRSWPLLLLAAPAGVAIWAGWVGLGKLTGFGDVQLLPGIWDAARIDSAITLPIGVETYAAYALRVWLTAGPATDPRAVRFAKASALASLLLGAAGQVAYHLMTAAGITRAPWQVTTLVACLPVAVLGMGAALAHLVHHGTPSSEEGSGSVAEPEPGTAPEALQEDTATPPAAVSAPSRVPQATTYRLSGTAGRVARLRAAHPDWTTAQLAKRAGVSERTVRRHLATAFAERVHSEHRAARRGAVADTAPATTTDSHPATSPARKPDTSTDTRTDNNGTGAAA